MRSEQPKPLNIIVVEPSGFRHEFKIYARHEYYLWWMKQAELKMFDLAGQPDYDEESSTFEFRGSLKDCPLKTKISLSDEARSAIELYEKTGKLVPEDSLTSIVGLIGKVKERLVNTLSDSNTVKNKTLDKIQTRFYHVLCSFRL